MAIQLQKLAGESLQKLAVKVGVDPNQAAAMATDNLIPLIIGSAARQSGALHLLADITGQLHGRAESNIKINWAI